MLKHWRRSEYKAVCYFVLFLTCVPALTAPGGVVAAGPAPIVFVLYDALNALADSAADYRRVLQNLLKKLPPESPQFLSGDLQKFLKRAPGAGMNFKCGADFMRYRARQELWRLKDKLLNSDPRPAEPQFCYAVPFAVDLAQPL